MHARPLAALVPLAVLLSCFNQTPTPAPPPTSAPQTAGATPAPAESPPATPVAACGPETHQLDGWSGEYPQPVVQVLTRVTLPARRAPCDPAPNTQCTLSPGLYHPWAGRAEQQFASLTRPHQTRTRRALSFDDATPSGALTVPAGEEITQLAYLSEGYCQLAALGQRFDGPCLSDEDLVEPVPRAGGRGRQMLSVPCPEGGRAWIEVDDALEARDEVQWGEVRGYGEIGPAAARHRTPSWVVCLTVNPDEAAARAEVARLIEAGLPADLLWIPDYGSLSGAEQWLVFTGPFPYEEPDAARAALKAAQAVLPSAYALKLDQSGPREQLKP